MCIEWFNTNSGLVSFITAIATVILAGGTIYYAWTNHKLWKNHEKISRNQRMLDEINYIILPIIEQCEGEIIELDKYMFWEILNDRIILKKIKINPIVEALFRDFLKDKKKLMSLIERHDGYVDDLVSSSETIKSTIKQKGFDKKVNDFILDFNKKYTAKKILNITMIPKLMLRHVLFNYGLNEKLLDGNKKIFWNEYEKELLKFRNIPALKPKIELMENSLKNIRNESNLIIRELRDIYNHYISKHHLPLEEIEKKHQYKFANDFFES